MIELSNGHKIKYVAASGALKFNGKGWLHEWPLRWMGLLDPSLFTVVIKTLTYYPRKGNYHWYWPLGCIRLIPDGVVNAVGLTNPGIDWFCRKVGPSIDCKRIALVASILSDNIFSLTTMARMLNEFDLVALALNWSCPNTERDFLENTAKIITGCTSVKKVSRFPLILKLSVVHDIKSILPEVVGIVEAISINSVPWEIIFPDKKSPLAHLGGGGVSGKVAQPHTWKFVEELVEKTSIPVIGPSVWEFDDIQGLRIIGAKAISFGSIFLRYPWRPTQFVKKDMKRNQK
ncbi:hypothetical protein KJA13_02030 [Patescibacteria group bacterium]|nr:hypothetical protein [Patescibacteria group bacterium]